MMCERSSATPTSEADLPTACYYLNSNYLRIVWCRAAEEESHCALWSCPSAIHA